MDPKAYLIRIKNNKTDKWEEKTNSIDYIEKTGDHFFDISFSYSQMVYSYSGDRVQFFSALQSLEPENYRAYSNGKLLYNVTEIIDFGPYLRVYHKGGNTVISSNELVKNALADADPSKIFEYLKAVTDSITLSDPETKKPILDEEGNEIKFLKSQYENKLKFIDDRTVLSCYLNKNKAFENPISPNCAIYPFGMNRSQMEAVKTALSNQVSVIQGPPGTGKTQTILNLIANLVSNNQTVAVVSNNNSATKNVLEKLEKSDLSFICAYLGNKENRNAFIENQSVDYPDMSKWELSPGEKLSLKTTVSELSEELYDLLNDKNRIAEINITLLNLEPQLRAILEMYDSMPENNFNVSVENLSSDQAIKLKAAINNAFGTKKKIGLWEKLSIFFHFGHPKGLWSLLSVKDFCFIDSYLEKSFYLCLKEELESEKERLNEKLRSIDFDQKSKELTDKSMRLFRANVSERYPQGVKRVQFGSDDLREKADEVISEYPVILSTTHSIRNSLSSDFVYDYLIMDESSQVDIVTGALAISCAKNVVIVGDLKQLPNIVPEDIREKEETTWKAHKNIPEAYKYHKEKQSFLQSVLDVWGDKVPVTTLREHYRCHPKIINFCNQKFYDNNLIIMTSDNHEEGVMSVHAVNEDKIRHSDSKRHRNMKQVDVIKEEIIPDLRNRGLNDIGVVTPYKEQVKAMNTELNDDSIEADTIHKYQGREKDAIIISTVDDVPNDFSADRNMLNVAVSRAVKSLSVVLSGNPENDKTLYGELVRYIMYHEGDLTEHKVYSIFDLLFKEYEKERKAFLKGKKKESEYDSENLMAGLLDIILNNESFQSLSYYMRYPLKNLIRDCSGLSKEEITYARQDGTHLDFLIYRKIDKSPVLAIEVDGEKYHEPGSIQYERDKKKNHIMEVIGVDLLRLRTTGSNEKEKIEKHLEEALSKGLF